MPEERVRGSGELLAEISRSMVGIQKELAGAGPTRAKTYWAGEDMLLVVMGGGFTAAEQTLYEGGKGSTVRDSRTAFADAVLERTKGLIRDLSGREAILRDQRFPPGSRPRYDDLRARAP